MSLFEYLQNTNSVLVTVKVFLYIVELDNTCMHVICYSGQAGDFFNPTESIQSCYKEL